MFIQAKRKTILKAKASDSTELSPGELASVYPGQKIELESIEEESHQHRFVRLKQAFGALKSGFIYAPHWEFANPNPKGDVLLNVPYYSQLDNSENLHGAGSRQCSLTSNAMAAEFILKDRSLVTLSAIAQQKGLREPESAYGEILDRYGDTTNHDANTQALRSLGLESIWSTQLQISDLVECINKRLPVPIGVHYKSSGHIICAIGYNLDREIIYVNDSYGARAGAADYYAVIGGGSGKFDTYSFDTMQRIWADPADGWGRKFIAVEKVEVGG